MDEKKKMLLEALARKWLALVDIEKQERFKDSFSKDEFDKTLNDLEKWVNIDTDQKYAALVLEREKRANRLGEVLKVLNKLIKSKGTETKDGFYPLSLTDLFERREVILKEMKLDYLIENDRKWRLVCSPKGYGLF